MYERFLCAWLPWLHDCMEHQLFIHELWPGHWRMLHTNWTRCIYGKGQRSIDKQEQNNTRFLQNLENVYDCTIIISELWYESVKQWQWQPLVHSAVALSVRYTSPSAAEWRTKNYSSILSLVHRLVYWARPILSLAPNFRWARELVWLTSAQTLLKSRKRANPVYIMVTFVTVWKMYFLPFRTQVDYTTVQFG